jgi:hypothetical protein
MDVVAAVNLADLTGRKLRFDKADGRIPPLWGKTRRKVKSQLHLNQRPAERRINREEASVGIARIGVMFGSASLAH